MTDRAGTGEQIERDDALEALRSAFNAHVLAEMTNAMMTFSTNPAAARERFRKGFALAREFYREERAALSAMGPEA